MLDHSIELIETPPALEALAGRIACAPAIAVDIETINWWDREAERVALLQLAFREGDRPRVAIVDTLAAVDLAPLHGPLAASPTPKAIHNASYDAVRLLRHYQILTAPIHDTMLAARRSGDRRWSLKAQVEVYLGLQLDKTEQRGDWGRRPLTREQLRYAALDAACTLLLYESQIERGLRGDYHLRPRATEEQSALPLGPEPAVDLMPRIPTVPNISTALAEAELDATALALLGIVCELGGRYSPEQLAASVGAERVGLAGWIVDRALGAETDIDEGTARGEIARLKDDGLIVINMTRRLEATPRGVKLWQRNKTSIN
jgi:hypothetical protein